MRTPCNSTEPTISRPRWRTNSAASERSSMSAPGTSSRKSRTDSEPPLENATSASKCARCSVLTPAHAIHHPDDDQVQAAPRGLPDDGAGGWPGSPNCATKVVPDRDMPQLATGVVCAQISSEYTGEIDRARD